MKHRGRPDWADWVTLAVVVAGLVALAVWAVNL